MRDPEAVPGWMLPDSLQWLHETASHQARIIEVGCWHGRSTRALVNGMRKDGVLIAVDAWLPQPEYPQDDAARALNGFFRNFKDEIKTGRVVVMRMDSLDAAKLLREDTFDLVFLDGDHAYNAVCGDIDAYLPLVGEGGILAGHDYWTLPGVTRAVDDLLTGVVRGPDSIWYKQL